MRAQVRDGVFQRRDRAGWWVSYIDSSGSRRKRKVEAYTRRQAMAALSALKTKAQKEQILGVKHVSEMSTAELFDRYKRYQRTRVRSTTFERLESILARLAAVLPGRLKDISRATVADFISTEAERVSPGTVQKEVSVLKHTLRMAVEWEFIHINPADRARVPTVPEGRTRYLSPTELKSILEVAPKWMKEPIALAAFTGMRKGELLGLRWRDVDLPGRRLYLHATKNGSLRVVPLNDLAIGVVESLTRRGPSESVLEDVDSARLSVYTKRLFASLHIEGASFHSLRHTAASWLVMEGVDLYAVGQILGHRTPRMTQRYAHLSPQFMASAVSKLDTVFSGVVRTAESPALVQTECQRASVGTLRGPNGLLDGTKSGKHSRRA